MRHSSKGFTLIELVVVIVILGILAATAAPKFISLTKDANEAKLDAFEAALNSANTLVHAKAIVAGKHTSADSSIRIDGKDVDTYYGYIDATADSVIAALDVNLVKITSATEPFAGDYGLFDTGATLVIIPTPSNNALSCSIIYSIAPNTGSVTGNYTDYKPVLNRSDCQ